MAQIGRARQNDTKEDVFKGMRLLVNTDQGDFEDEKEHLLVQIPEVAFRRKIFRIGKNAMPPDLTLKSYYGS